MTDKYMSIVTYRTSDGEEVNIKRNGFGSVKDATSWMLGKIGYLVLRWGQIDENGLLIYAEVCDEGGLNSIGFTDYYEVNCGC